MTTSAALPPYTSVTQGLIAPAEFKLRYGDVRTPFSLIESMLGDLPASVWSRPDYRWLDPCVGRGYFLMVVHSRLMHGLRSFPGLEDEGARSRHIVKNMLFGVEINPVNVSAARMHFSQRGHEPNIVEGDFLSMYAGGGGGDGDIDRDSDGDDGSDGRDGALSYESWPDMFDVVVANPPYNVGGRKKVPTADSDKRADGRTAWCDFVTGAFLCLARSRPERPTYCTMIVPSIWMKPDRAGMYHLLSCRAGLRIRCFSNTATNSMFSRQAQTPTCYFSAENRSAEAEARSGTTTLRLYDDARGTYVPYPFRHGEPIPCAYPALMAGLRAFARARPSFPALARYVRKTMMPRSANVLSAKYVRTPERALRDVESARDLGLSPNIRTCVLEDKRIPRLVCQNSSEDCTGAGLEKLVLAHKMYGFPYHDSSGTWGVCTRDNYIIHFPDEGEGGGERNGEREGSGDGAETARGRYAFYADLLSTPLARCIFESTRYRMCYLEKYAFELIPDMVRDTAVLQFWRRWRAGDAGAGETGAPAETREYDRLLELARFVLETVAGIPAGDEYAERVLGYDSVEYGRFSAPSV
jgi:hypothetical protein